MPQPRPAASKVLPIGRLLAARRLAKRQGRTVVFTNGCFDLVHAGHVQTLERARALGDLLIVGLNSDRSVRALKKGPGRPLVEQRNRARVLAALECVDYVTLFDAATPAALIAALTPDVLVKGADWATGRIVGQEAVERHGGRVVRIPLVRGLSTTQLIKKIRRAG